MAWGRKKSGGRREPQFGLTASLAELRLSPKDRVAAGDHTLHHFRHVRRNRDRAVPADREATRRRREDAVLSSAFLRLGACLFTQLLADFGDACGKVFLNASIAAASCL